MANPDMATIAVPYELFDTFKAKIQQVFPQIDFAKFPDWAQSDPSVEEWFILPKE